MSARKRVLRIFQREYLPMLGSIVMWAMAAAAVGMAEAARLLAALTLVRSVQLFTRMPTLAALRRRVQAPQMVWRRSAKRARRMQFFSLIAGIAVLAALVGLLVLADQPHLAALVALMVVGYPARNLLQAQGRCDVGMYIVTVQWAGAALIAPAHALDWGAREIAYMIGLREWVAGLLSLLRQSPRKGPDELDIAPITMAEIAAITGLRARRAFTYRLGKVVLATVLPGSGLVARTGRGFNLHHRLERFVPRHRPMFILFAISACAGAAVLVAQFPKPLLLVVAAMLVRLAAAAGAAVIWWNYIPDPNFVDLDEDDD